MEIIKSPLVLLEFSVLKSDYSYKPPTKEEELNFAEIAEKYFLDFDFEIRTAEEDVYLIFTKVIINDREPKLPGHSINLEAVSVFQINTDNLDESTITSILNFSAPSIAFGNVRNYIVDITSYSPAGKYFFPVFDLQSLVKMKYDEYNKRQKAESTAKRKQKVNKVKKAKGK